MEEELILLCKNTMTGIFSGIYDAYQYKKKRNYKTHERIHLATQEPYIKSFMMEYITVEEAESKAMKVAHVIEQLSSQDTYRYFCHALASDDEEMADAVYHSITILIKEHEKRIFDRLYEPCVIKTFELARHVNNEILHLQGFLRFAELKDHILYAKITPKNNIIGFLAEHFQDRFPAENFIIHDEGRNLYAVHECRKQYILASGQVIPESALAYSEDELHYRALFRYFCQKIAIVERSNYELQRNMLPLRFRGNMVEFNLQ